MAITTIRKVVTNEKMVALTFDDGPHPVYTPRALASLQQYQSQATWFILGKQAQNNLPLVTQISAGENDIGVHSYDHVSLTGLSRAQIISQLGRTRNLIEQATGRFWPYFRPPNGAYNNKVLEAAASLGFQWNVLWSVDPRDYASSASQIINHVLARIEPGAIIILHEVTAPTTAALPVILREMGKRGYQAVTLGRLLESAVS